ncbi:MAG: energy transducer TonB [Gemmataceae bacterium]|nr:energy transducer TonB [Gemmataceae bacterium]MDW8265859.1 energy transducer TonB [Gemmataceae bacterium]
MSKAGRGSFSETGCRGQGSWRDPFAVALALSLGLHGGLGVCAWLGPSGEQPPEPLPVQVGRVSLALREVTAVAPEPAPIVLPKAKAAPQPPALPALPPLPRMETAPVLLPPVPHPLDVVTFRPPPPTESAKAPSDKPSVSSQESQGADVPWPRIAANPAPEYPREALEAGQEGVVRLRVRVGVDGRPVAVSVDRSSGYPLLDRSALTTVQRLWRFVPARSGGVPVEKEVIVPVRFRIEGN